MKKGRKSLNYNTLSSNSLEHIATLLTPNIFDFLFPFIFSNAYKDVRNLAILIQILKITPYETRNIEQ